MKQEAFVNTKRFKEEKERGKLMGGFLIIMGAIFFLGLTEVSILGYDPWLLMALLPVYWIGVMAYKRYKEDGRVSRSVFYILVFGLFPFAYIAAAILDLNVAAIWPLSVIAVGVGFILFGKGK
jgi:hypothetical protein